MYFSLLGVVAFVWANVASCALFPQRVYLLPEGIEGDVYIFHTVPRGETIEHSVNTTTFRIPNSRFLITQWVPSDSPYMSSFYYVDSNGVKTQLEVENSSLHKTEENLANKRPFIWNPGRSVSSRWSAVPCEIKYEQFYVGTRPKMLARTQKERDDEHFRFREFVEANVDLLCEGKPTVQTSFPKQPPN